MSLHIDCRHRYASGFELKAAFTANAGLTALFGPSGSGKTTTLNLIAGILRPAAGRIELAGRVLFDARQGVCLPPEARQIALVFQDHLLFPHLNVRQNLLFGRRRRPTRVISVERVVQILEIGDLLERMPHTLSGGQKQRVSLGRAILRAPSLLLLDEPVAALETTLKEQILNYLEKLTEEWHIPTIFVSHDQAVVSRLADQVIILREGNVVTCGTAEQTLHKRTN
jgi:molybdate transport system ATP-binding protein